MESKMNSEAVIKIKMLKGSIALFYLRSVGPFTRDRAAVCFGGIMDFR